MCLIPDGGGQASAPRVVERADPRAAAAADALAVRRKSAQGYSSSILGGMNDSSQPSLARQMLGMG